MNMDLSLYVGNDDLRFILNEKKNNLLKVEFAYEVVRI